MPKKIKGSTGDLIAELIHHELQAQLSKLVRKAKRKANREAGKLNDMLRLEYHRNGGFMEAEVINLPAERIEEVKKTENGSRE